MGRVDDVREVQAVAAVLMSPRQAAERVQVSPGTIRRWIEQGRVPGVLRTPTGLYRLPPEAVDRLLQPVQPPTEEGPHDAA